MARFLKLEIECGDEICNPDGVRACRNLVQYGAIQACRLFLTRLHKTDVGIEHHGRCLTAEQKLHWACPD